MTMRAAVHVVERVEERTEAPRDGGLRGRFAGREPQPEWSGI